MSGIPLACSISVRSQPFPPPDFEDRVSTLAIAERTLHARTFSPNASDSEVVELPLLLPRWQVAALEAAARRNGLTTGQLIRRMITDLVSENDPNHF
jgi:hypothetical protein